MGYPDDGALELRQEQGGYQPRAHAARAREQPYENVYTLALRGLHDGAMSTTLPMHEKVRMLQQALLDQRQILAENIDRPVETVPQAFTPYKEVLEIYSNGLELPDDVTIVWPDDNYGYMKRLSGVREQRRTGRSGVYYHVSYLGVPHSYLWFSTTPPSLMYEELRKAYDTTADRLWLLNCGDLKGSEMQVSLFLDMAWDIGRFTADNVVSYPARWLAGIFGEAYYDRLEAMTREHLRLAFPANPNTWAGATTGTASTTTASSLPTPISRSPTTTRHSGGWRPTGSSAPGPKPCCTRSATKPARLSTSWSTTPCAAPN